MTKKTTAALQVKLECLSAYFISVIASIKWFFFSAKAVSLDIAPAEHNLTWYQC